MNEKLENFLTHALTFAGGTLVTAGVIEQGMLVEVVGAIITLTGFVMNLLRKKKDGNDETNV